MLRLAFMLKTAHIHSQRASKDNVCFVYICLFLCGCKCNLTALSLSFFGKRDQWKHSQHPSLEMEIGLHKELKTSQWSACREGSVELRWELHFFLEYLVNLNCLCMLCILILSIYSELLQKWFHGICPTRVAFVCSNKPNWPRQIQIIFFTLFKMISTSNY